VRGKICPLNSSWFLLYWRTEIKAMPIPHQSQWLSGGESRGDFAKSEEAT